MRAQPRQSQARRMPHELHEHSHRRSDEARWTCPPDPAAGQPPLDVRDMIVVHTALLREFRLAPAAVTRVPAGDRRRAATVSGHLGFLCDLLHHHHQGEDELLWPTLRSRVPAAAGRLIDDAEAQHHGIDDALRRVQELRTGWTADPSTERGAKLATQLENLHALLGKHLDFEERALLPLAASTFTEQEWRDRRGGGRHDTEAPAGAVLRHVRLRGRRRGPARHAQQRPGPAADAAPPHRPARLRPPGPRGPRHRPALIGRKPGGPDVGAAVGSGRCRSS
jgi:hemerythrin-like domain-containing protein